MRTTEADKYYFASDYAATLKDIGRFLPFVKRVDFEFDEYNGNIHAVIDECDFYACYYSEEKQTMRHVVRILNSTLFNRRAGKTYYGSNGKKRHSKVLFLETPDISRMALDDVFWKIVKERFRLLCKLYRFGWEIDVRDEIQEFYDDVLTDFLEVVIQDYYNDIHADDEEEDEEEDEI